MDIIETSSEPKTTSEQIRTLEPQTLDLDSLKIQVLFGLAGILIICLTNYFPILNSGFLSDRLQPLQDIARAFHGQWQYLFHDLTDYLYGGPGENRTSFVVAFSLLTDFGVWHLHALGYFLTNIFIHCLSCGCVVLLSLELSGLKGNRMGAATAIWAGLLYAVNPLNGLSVSILATRDNLLSSLFYLAAVMFFLRFQLLREHQYLLWATVCAGLHFSIDKSALTLPLVMVFASLLCSPLDPSRPHPGETSKGSWLGQYKRLATDTWMFWALEVTCLISARTELSPSRLEFGWWGCQTMIWPVLGLIPIKAYLPHLVSTSLRVGLAIVLTLGLMRCPRQHFNWRPYLFLILWMVAILDAPTDLLNCLHPEEGLASLGIVPICLLLSHLALPAFDLRGARSVRPWAALGCTALTIIVVCWSYALQLNVSAELERHPAPPAVRTPSPD